MLTVSCGSTATAVHPVRWSLSDSGFFVMIGPGFRARSDLTRPLNQSLPVKAQSSGRGQSRDGRRESEGTEDMTLDDESSVYVGGLPYDATEDSLRKTFSRYGSVVAVKVLLSVLRLAVS